MATMIIYWQLEERNLLNWEKSTAYLIDWLIDWDLLLNFLISNSTGNWANSLICIQQARYHSPLSPVQELWFLYSKFKIIQFSRQNIG